METKSEGTTQQCSKITLPITMSAIDKWLEILSILFETAIMNRADKNWSHSIDSQEWVLVNHGKTIRFDFGLDYGGEQENDSDHRKVIIQLRMDQDAVRISKVEVLVGCSQVGCSYNKYTEKHYITWALETAESLLS